MIKVGSTEESILQQITSNIEKELDLAGLFFRVFSRVKSVNSINKKLSAKASTYFSEKRKMQDILGVRITLYFLDDRGIAINLVKGLFEEIPDSHCIDTLNKDQFGPVRNNLVFSIPDTLSALSSLFSHELIDSTFEVQFRTVFSEGWHEVEHDFRYKCKSDWDNQDILYRQLNGQLAALETSDWAILKILDEFAYKKYKEKEWDSFFRNLLRIRFEDMNFSSPIVSMFDKNPEIAKEFLKHDREKLISSLILLKTRIPLSMDNVLFIINRALFKKEQISAIETEILKGILDESFPN